MPEATRAASAAASAALGLAVEHVNRQARRAVARFPCAKASRVAARCHRRDEPQSGPARGDPGGGGDEGRRQARTSPMRLPGSSADQRPAAGEAQSAPRAAARSTSSGI